jgi:hypothetical protein
MEILWHALELKNKNSRPAFLGHLVLKSPAFELPRLVIPVLRVIATEE